MKRTMLLVVAMIWSISVFAAMPPFDHKVKINPTDAWATITNQTANYDDESKFGLTESSNTWSVNVADNNDVLPASVVWNDRVVIGTTPEPGMPRCVNMRPVVEALVYQEDEASFTPNDLRVKYGFNCIVKKWAADGESPW